MPHRQCIPIPVDGRALECGARTTFLFGRRPALSCVRTRSPNTPRSQSRAAIEIVKEVHIPKRRMPLQRAKSHRLAGYPWKKARERERTACLRTAAVPLQDHFRDCFRIGCRFAACRLLDSELDSERLLIRFEGTAGWLYSPTSLSLALCEIPEKGDTHTGRLTHRAPYTQSA